MIRWFTHNHVAANLLMCLIIGLGFLALKTQMPLEVFPSFALDRVTISSGYPGATPAEVEESLTIRIEEAIQDLEGIESLSSRSSEGSSVVFVDLLAGVEPRDMASDIRDRMERLTTLPDDVETPTVTVGQHRREVISVVVSGALQESELRDLGQRVRDDLLRLDGITQVDLEAVRPMEISIEASELSLQEHGLGLSDIANAIRRGSAEAAAGSILTDGGEVLLRTQGFAREASEFEDIVVAARADGSQLRLAAIAEVRDGFDQQRIKTLYNAEPAVLLEIYRVGDQSAIEVADTVKDYIAEQQSLLPNGVSLSYWRDRSAIVKNRINTLTNSALQGGILVIVLLTLFLRPGVAFWVSIGVPVSFLGCFILLPWLGVTLNIISLFAFILVLGIVVDDAIVTGENIYRHMREGKDSLVAAIEGTQEVAVPVTFGILTTVVAFIPLFMVEGARGQIFAQIPAVVIPVLLFSLIESKLVLPAHLKHVRRRAPDAGGFTQVQRYVADGLEALVRRAYTPFLAKCTRHRYTTVAVFVAVLTVTIGVMSSGWLKFIFFPRVQSEVARVSLTMPVGTPFEVTDAHMARIVAAAQEIQAEHKVPGAEQSIITGILSTTGSSGGTGAGRSHTGRMVMEIMPPESRQGSDVTSGDLVKALRKAVGTVPGAESLTYRAEIGRGGDPIDVQFIGDDLAVLREVGVKTREHLGQYPGLFDIVDTLSQGKQEMSLSLKPAAVSLGVQVSDLANQVRQAFYGIEIQRILRQREEVKVFLRYPEHERHSLDTLMRMYIRTPGGVAVPLSEVADAVTSTGPSTIYRVDRERTLNVTADANKQQADLTAIKRSLRTYLDNLVSQYPGIRYSLEGEEKEQRQSFGTLQYGLIGVLFAIYALLAIPFRSYFQPLAVMVVIPFGIVGAVAGHLIMGKTLSIMSLMGMLALSGVVVNDSLVLVDYINKQRALGKPLQEAIQTAGSTRFRPVLLTSLTTFAGLMPLLLEKSTQAQFLIPMAISLGFGILFATAITLLLVPCNYLIGQDIAKLLTRLREGLSGRAAPKVSE